MDDNSTAVFGFSYPSKHRINNAGNKMPFHITQAISIFYKEVSPDDDTEDVDPLTCKCILTIFIKEFAWNCVAFDTNNNMSC